MNMLKKLFSNQLISGSSVIVIGSFLANVINAFFNLFIARNLSVVDYGVVASLISLITLPAYAANSIVPTVVQFGGKYFSSNDLASAAYLFKKISKIILAIALVIFILLVLFTGQINTFLKIDDPYLIILTNLIIFIGFFIFLNLAMLQAKVSFNFISFFQLFSAICKLLLGSFLVYIGLKVWGVIAALFLTSVFSYILSLIPLKFVFGNYKNKVKERVLTGDLIKYGIPSTVALISLTSFITTDILLAKHFFDENLAGLYSGLSLAGRVIFYVTQPITTVMFPLIVRKRYNNENYNSTFLMAVFLVLLASVMVTMVYKFIPDFVISILLNKTEYYAISDLLFLSAINITLYSIVSLFINYYLAIKKTFVFFPVFLTSLSQILLLSIFHRNLSDFVNSSIFILFVLFILLLLYYPYAAKKD